MLIFLFYFLIQFTECVKTLSESSPRNSRYIRYTYKKALDKGTYVRTLIISRFYPQEMTHKPFNQGKRKDYSCLHQLKPVYDGPRWRECGIHLRMNRVPAMSWPATRAAGLVASDRRLATADSSWKVRPEQSAPLFGLLLEFREWMPNCHFAPTAKTLSWTTKFYKRAIKKNF